MGYIKHDAIVCTSWKRKHLEQARSKAIKFGLKCTGITDSDMNDYDTFCIIPDGSKEGWETSDKAEEARNKWKKWCEAKTSFYLNWVHVSFGGDDLDSCKIVGRG
jgi:hypothetical protein